ncbi:efflux RND transporter periplasmic adaptor subunit [Paralcaligenes ureilyticus]|uniref:Membrane fusion protein (Multidrug efflux system) n=1 Tax=Paralcaligenes ureilyticus TaxID=627131 RepID=A0A4R3LRQ7_9BURK|nr:efflux RND transporter periplasmic adaptor subunit [Paralcaligenes ureilyticus]TCT03090.1 membrane fusion protein (multidrug efflux system) [Paralcaligenes ureilyticus]
MKNFILRTAPWCLALLLTACGESKDPAPTPPPPLVGVVTTHVENVPLVKNLVGRLSAFRSADVNARVAGVLLKRAYVEGSEVKKGQLLFEIDPAPLKAALASATAQLAKDQANLGQARVNLARYQRLNQQKAIAEQIYSDQKFLVRQEAATVEVDQAGVQTARINLGYAHVTSPIAGRAGQQQVTEGALVGQGSATLLTTVSQLDPLYVNFAIGVNDLNELQRAAERGDIQLTAPNKTTVKVTLPDGTPYAVPGTVDFSAPTVDPSTGSVTLRALLPNPKFRLLPGTYVTLQLALGERHNAFLIPQPAVQRDITGTYVLVVGKDSKVTHRNVTTNGTQGVDWVVTSGLSAGDQVIVSGLQMVQLGAQAKTEPWQPPASTAKTTGAAVASAKATDGE